MISLATGIINKLLQITTNKKWRHHKIIVPAKIKLNSIETLLFPSLKDIEISHEKLKTIDNEKKKYQRMKEVIKVMKISDKLGECSKSIRKEKIEEMYVH